MSSLQIYNSLSRKKEAFKPINAENVRMYVCGMTVYDFCHIGHARVMVVFDTLARHLRRYYPVTFVRNITDIDDKIIARAHENNESIEALTQRFIDAMHEDEAAIGCLPPDFEPKATENVAGMIKLVSRLIEKGFAYPAENGDVYYSVRKFADYGKLSNRKLEDLRVGERIAVNEAKKDPLDFVLWKAAKENEPYWESPWGKGRPGWHLECSEMSQKILGDHFDIHGGGMDLKFPHHECEIAQSEADSGHKNVNYWLHNGFVQIDNEKMSKSLGNFFTVREVLKKFDGEVIRFFMLQTHYRSPLNFSDAGLEEAKKGLMRLYAAINQNDMSDTAGATADTENDYQRAFDEAMNDDLNTSKAISVLFEIAKDINKSSGDDQLAKIQILKKLAGFVGLLNQNPSEFLKGKNIQSDFDESNILAMIESRNEAKKNKDYQRADGIRDQLLAQGIVIKDTANGTEWQYQ